MAIHLNKNGGLTKHQRIRADAIGMNHAEYAQHIVNRLLEASGGKPPSTKRSEALKRYEIEAVNPVLVVGAGPSYKLNFENIRK